MMREVFSMDNKRCFNRRHTMYQAFTGGSISPRGWMERQLKLQANGQAGQLDQFWPDVRDSKWIGGTAEGWERVPYWLDGFIPLAYLLRDEGMIARAEKYVQGIIAQQQPDGWICPCKDEERATYDIWALLLIGKVLALYCECTGSKQVEEALYRAMKNAHHEFSSGHVKLSGWSAFRWYEGLVGLKYLKDRYPEAWIDELARIWQEQGTDMPSLMPQWIRPMNVWRLETHIVNICMSIKYEALACSVLGGEYTNQAEVLWKHLEKYNSTAAGVFTGDECLAGTQNNQGTELCAVVELMYSCERLLELTGDPIWAERLEKIAFNALPATISDDMWTHQYVQQANQICCTVFPNKPMWRTNNGESGVFGLEPGFGCCTANHGQGWPKLMLSAFLRSEDGIYCPVMLPACLNTEINGVKVQVEMVTDYPFRHSCRYIVRTDAPVDFALKIRVPAWADQVKVDGVKIGKADCISLGATWSGEIVTEVELSGKPHLVKRPRDMAAVEYGPLVFSLPIEADYKMREYVRDNVERKAPYCDWDITPKSDWNYGFASARFTVEQHDVPEIPFSSKAPAVTLKASMAKVDWPYADGYDTVADVTPASRKAISAPEEKQLYPYGCAKLRMTEMPRTRG